MFISHYLCQQGFCVSRVFISVLCIILLFTHLIICWLLFPFLILYVLSFISSLVSSFIFKNTAPVIDRFCKKECGTLLCNILTAVCFLCYFRLSRLRCRAWRMPCMIMCADIPGLQGDAPGDEWTVSRSARLTAQLTRCSSLQQWPATDVQCSHLWCNQRQHSHQDYPSV